MSIVDISKNINTVPLLISAFKVIQSTGTATASMLTSLVLARTAVNLLSSSGTFAVVSWSSHN